ncbi:tetratricopeptide repeat protein [Candidatus Amoebophilus asiaticus]|nr:tetratricopeptide repeat protein [Candidatus Amoebophilus asiaticus]
MYRIAATCFLVCSFYTLQAQFDFNANCIAAYQSLFSLQLDKAKELIEREKLQNPDNLIPIYIENYIEFFVVFIGENENDFHNYKEGYEKRLEKINPANEDSPFYLFIKAELLIQSAFIRIKFDEYITASYEFYKAYNLIEDNISKYPAFKPNYKCLGMLHALVGSVPEKYRWVINLIGLEGTLEQGLAELKELIKDKDLDKKYRSLYVNETKILSTFILIQLKLSDQREWEHIDFTEAEIQDNLLFQYITATKQIKSYQNDTAIIILENRSQSAAYYPFYFLDYLTGLTKFRRLDSGAYVHFEKFLFHFKGINYIKDAYQKLAWYHLINKDTVKYHYYISLCKKAGFTYIDEDKNAAKEADSGIIPNVNLLKARLLFDGGYFSRALAILENHQRNEDVNEEEKAEIVYRKARILHEWGKWDEAMPYYLGTIERYGKTTHYYAANAALNVGYIYEEKGDLEKAQYFFTKCLKMDDHEYKQSINYKAKLALKRIEKK